MLLGAALSLAHELGLFQERPAETIPQDRLRFHVRVGRIHQLMFVYINSLAARRGWTTLMPRLFIPANQSQVEDNETWHKMMSSWIELTRLAKTSSDVLFPSKKATRGLVRGGTYVSLLEHFNPLLKAWNEQFQQLQSISHLTEVAESVPGRLAPIIGIEYHYLRMYINSLAVHAIYERRLAGETELKNDSSEQGFIAEVLDGSRQVLQIIISLDRENVLSYAPAKPYLILTSAATYLLKVHI
jgi:hypothetical protein